MSAYVVPTHRGYAAPLGSRAPAPIAGSYLVVRRAQTLVLLDAARFRRERGASENDVMVPAVLDAFDQRAPDLEPGMIRVRTGAGELLGNVGRDHDSIVPHAGSWDRTTAITDITATPGPMRIVYGPGGGPARPSTAMLDLLGLLAVVGRHERLAAAAFSALVTAHSVVVALRPGTTPRELATSEIPHDRDVFVIWSRAERTWAIEAVSPEAELRTWDHRDGRKLVSPTEVLRLVDRVASGWPVPASDGIHRLHGECWQPLAERPSDDQPVDSHALVQNRQARLLRLAAPRRFEDAAAVLLRLTDPALKETAGPLRRAASPRPTVSVTPAQRRSVADAVAATWSFTAHHFGATDDPKAVAELSALSRKTVSGVQSPITPEIRSLMRRTTQASFEAHHKIPGRGRLAWLSLELALESPDATTAQQMADALAFYLSATTAQQREPLWWIAPTIVRDVRQWVRRRRIRWDHYELLRETDVADPRFGELAAAAPWLWWYAPPDSAPGPIHLTEAELIETLALLRPQFVFRQRVNRGGVPVRKPFSERFRALFVFPLADEVDDGTLEALSEALLHYFGYPSRAAATVQGIDLPDAYRATLRDLLNPEPAPSQLEQVLAVRSRTPEVERVMVVNLSEKQPLTFSLGRQVDVRLEQKAIEQEEAVDYVSLPLEMGDAEALTVNGDHLSLRVEPVEMAPPAGEQHFTIAAALFRGRENELNRLRIAVQERGRRAGSLIIGNRRAGKTTLAWRITEEPEVRGSLFLDLAAVRWDDIGGWNRRIVRKLLTLARLEFGVRPDVEADADLVEAIEALDQSLAGDQPVVLILDELDVLLTVDRGTEARRLAGRLGAAALTNLVVLGTAQRFHGAATEFKDWRIVPCPTDLSWKDAVTYFLPVLADRAPGPRVVQPDLAALSPQVFRREVHNLLGLRPYFWGQLRGRMDSLVRFDPTRSRIIGLEDTRAACDKIVEADAHLAAPLDVAPGLTVDEAQRRDLFTADERAILLLLAELGQAKEGISLVAAHRAGGTSATDSLIERAYLTPYSNGEQLRTAVPIYHRYLRSRLGQLRDIVASERGGVVPALAEAPESP